MAFFRVSWDNRSDVYIRDNDQIYNFAYNHKNHKHIEGLSQHVCWVTFSRVSWLASISLLSIHNNRGTFRACPDMVVRLHFLNQSVTSVTFQIFHWFTLTLPTRLSLKSEYTLDSKFNLVSGCLYRCASLTDCFTMVGYASVTYCCWWQNTTPFASKLLHNLLHTQATRKIWTGCCRLC